MRNCLLAFGLLLIAVVVKSGEDAKKPALSVGFISARDKTALKKVFDAYQLSDVQSVYYAVMGYKSLGETFKGAKEACKEFFHASKSTDLERIYFGVLGSELLRETCGAITVPEFVKMWEAKMTVSASSEVILQLVSIAQILKTPVDFQKVLPILKALKTNDMSVSTLSNIVAVLPYLRLTKSDLLSFVPIIKQILEQADEADSKYLYYEKGTFTTAIVVDGIIKFGSLVDKMPDVTEQQVIKLANALYSRRHTTNIRAAAYLISALKTLSANNFMVPVIISGISEHHVAGASGIVVPETRKLSLKLTDIYGGSLAPFITLSATGLYKNDKLEDEAIRGDFKISTDEICTMDLKAVSQGWYELEVSAKLKKPDAKTPKLVGISSVRIPLRVFSTVNVDTAKLSVSTTSQSRSSNDIPLVMGKKAVIPGALMGGTADSISMLSGQTARLNFNLVDAVSKAAIEPHQVFVQLTHKTSHLTVTYVVMALSAGSYSYKLNVDVVAKDFQFVSGIYSMDLIVGDALLSNSFSWSITDLDIHFPVNADVTAAAEKEDVSMLSVKSVAGNKHSHPLVGTGPSKIKPELKNTFRTPDPRPSNFVAFTFTGLCLSPILVLLISWPIIGANIRNFPCSLAALVFHAGLICIFSLYLCYWVQLDMFVTLRYLTLIGLITFFAGNRLLRHMSSISKSPPATTTN